MFVTGVCIYANALDNSPAGATERHIPLSIRYVVSISVMQHIKYKCTICILHTRRFWAANTSAHTTPSTKQPSFFVCCGMHCGNRHKLLSTTLLAATHADCLSCMLDSSTLWRSDTYNRAQNCLGRLCTRLLPKRQRAKRRPWYSLKCGVLRPYNPFRLSLENPQPVCAGISIFAEDDVATPLQSNEIFTLKRVPRYSRFDAPRCCIYWWLKEAPAMRTI